MISNLPEEDGVFSGFNEKNRDVRSGDMELFRAPGESRHIQEECNMGQGALPQPLPPMPAKIDVDLTLQNPRCVFQQLRQHYSRYTPK